jgi:hypothetical protein
VKFVWTCTVTLAPPSCSSVRTFLACRQVKDKEAARAIVENQAAPHHDIWHTSGINIKRLLPPPRVLAEASGSTPPRDIRKRKRKGSSQGEISRPEPQINLEVSRTEAPQSGPGDQPQATEPGVEVDPGAPDQGPEPSRAPAPVWAPTYEVFGNPVRSDATIMVAGEVGSNVASTLSEVARLPEDMAVWGKSTDQGVIDNLRRDLMMVSSSVCPILVLCSE